MKALKREISCNVQAGVKFSAFGNMGEKNEEKYERSGEM
jgi:hypothetical protein